MKKYLLCVLSIVSTALFLGCPNAALTKEDAKDSPQAVLTPSKSFNAINTTNNTWYTVNANLLASGTYCLIYVETGASVTQEKAQQIAAEFDNKIYTHITTNFGIPEDVNGDGKITILLLDILDGYTGSGGYVGGFFQGTHMFSKSTYAKSNEADMLFMDINPMVAGSSDFYETLAHEFQHLINFSYTSRNKYEAQDLWINEGLSAAAEYVYSNKIDKSRIDWFNDSTNTKSKITYGNNFFVWKGKWEENEPNSILDNYATVYLFFQWLRIHASNGTGIYKEILESSYRDYHAVTTAAASRISSNLSTWEKLLETWLLANIYGSKTDLYGYKEVLTVKMPYFFTTNNQKQELAPGEAVLSRMPGVNGTTVFEGTYTPSSGSGSNIRYRGIGYSGTIDTTTPYTGYFSLVFNANSDKGGSTETAYIANIEATEVAQSQNTARLMATTEIVHPKSWKMDVQFDANGTIDEESMRSLNKNSNSFSGAQKGSRGR